MVYSQSQTASLLLRSLPGRMRLERAALIVSFRFNPYTVLVNFYNSIVFPLRGAAKCVVEKAFAWQAPG